jgi:hypothetical protein
VASPAPIEEPIAAPCVGTQCDVGARASHRHPSSRRALSRGAAALDAGGCAR